MKVSLNDETKYETTFTFYEFGKIWYENCIEVLENHGIYITKPKSYLEGCIKILMTF